MQHDEPLHISHGPQHRHGRKIPNCTDDAVDEDGKGELMLRIRQYLCRHDFKFIAKHGTSSQNLWQCPKCKVFCIQHWGVGTYYYAKTPELDGWVYEEKKRIGVDRRCQNS